MCQVQSSFARWFVVALLMAFVVRAEQPGYAAGPEKKETPAVDGQLPVKMTRDQRSFYNRTQRQLVSKLVGDDNPGDSKTWYTLLFLDEVAVQELGRHGSGLVLATTLAAKPHGMVVQGKEEAALEVAKFWYGVNSAAKGLTPQLSPRSSVSRGVGNKRWWFYSYKSQEEAQSQLTRAIPPHLRK